MRLLFTPRRSAAVLIVAIGLLIGVLRLAGPAGDLYPVEGDSAKYHAIARGFSETFSHPFSSLKLWITRSATQTDLQRLGFDSWVLQHAPAYTALVGLSYLLPGDDIAAGRLLTVLLFALGACLLFLLGAEIFGFWQGLLGAALYLFWPAHWYYAPAILTEVPMAVAGLFAAYMMVRTAGQDSARRWFLGGVAIGLMVLTKTPLRFVAIPWIVIEALVDRRGGRNRIARRGAYRAAGWGATQLLWLLFLWGFHLSPNPLKGMGEDWLWVYRGNYVPDRGWETLGIGDAVTPELEEGGRRAESLPADERKGAIYRNAFLATVRNHPGGMAALILAKAGIYWGFPAVKTFVRAGPVSLPPPSRLQPALAIAALFGLAMCIGRGRGGKALPAVVPIFLTMLYASTHLVSRYDIPAIPFAMLYGAGAAGALAGALRPMLRGIGASPRRLPSPGRGTARDLLFAIGGVAIAVLILRVRHAVWIAPITLSLGFLPLLFQLFGRGRVGLARSLVVLVPLCVLAVGAIADNADPDQDRIRLRKAGDGVRLRLSLPHEAVSETFVAGEVLLDMLPSPRGTMSLSVRLSGREIARFDGRPPSSPEAFLLDRDVHADGERYRRILRSMERNLDGFVRRQPGMKNAGLDTYRQWFRIPVDPAAAFASPAPVLELVLLSSDGGWIDLYTDRDAPGSGSPARVFEMPAFFDNAYELSYYRFETLASRRELADSRLIRPVRVLSARQGAERFDSGGRTSPLRGEPRMRLRGKLPGGFGLVREGSGGAQAAWVREPAAAIRMLSPPEIRFLQADRDRYFDGWLTF